jgi:small subunit ribosomal protein S6
MLYELLYIIPTPYTENDLPNIQKNVNQAIEETGAKITREENLGNKRLTYEIKTVKRGYYILLNLEGSPEATLKIEQKLKLMPEVLRFQIIRTKTTKRIIRAKHLTPRLKTAIKKEPAEKVDLKTLGEEIDKLLEI